MSFSPFPTPDAAAATMSNLVLFKKQVTILTTAGTTNYFLFEADGRFGQFVPLEVWFHVDDNSGSDTLQFTASVTNNTCPSAVRGTTGATAALQLRQYKAVKFPTNIASTYFTNYATNAGAATYFYYLQVTVPPALQIIGTMFVLGYYTGMRP